MTSVRNGEVSKMQPLLKGITAGLLLSLGLVAGVNLIYTVSSSGTVASPSTLKDLVSATTTSTETSTTAILFGAGNASLNTAATAGPRAQSPSVSELITLLPILAALALGASVYLLSRTRIEREG